MTTQIARNDAVIRAQVTTLTPAAVNASVYNISINGKSQEAYTADGDATVQEIVEGVQALLDANDFNIPEYAEAVFTENNAIITAVGLGTGKPFTLVDESTGGGTLTVANTVSAKSPNHWIAENFNTGTLPANGDDVVISNLTTSQSFKWGIDHNAVTLGSLDIKADSEAEIGLPFVNSDNSIGSYYQEGYRDTHLIIGASILRIGDGTGPGSKRIQIDLQAVDCAATIYKTSTSKADQDYAPVHLAGGTATSSLQVVSGEVDLAMLPGYTGSWGTIIMSSGLVRCGAGVTLAVVEVSGGLIETRSAVTTLRTRGNGRCRHIGAANVTTADIQGGPLEVEATGALTIATLNGYTNATLNLTNADSLVTVTNMNVYATPDAPFTILDPNNKLVMTNAASTPNGVQSLKVVTGSGRSVRVT